MKLWEFAVRRPVTVVMIYIGLLALAVVAFTRLRIDLRPDISFPTIGIATIYQGAGAFVCGEETALMRSIEGKRGMPVPRPPFPAQKGLWDKPSVLNNVETYANIPQIILNGSDWYRSLGTEKSTGTKVFALSGAISNIGLIEVPMGIPLRKIIFDIGGGIPNKRKFKAVQLGGPSGGCIPEHLLDTPVTYEDIVQTGAIVGSGGMVVMNDLNCMVSVAKFFLEFTAEESCG